MAQKQTKYVNTNKGEIYKQITANQTILYAQYRTFCLESINLKVSWI
uniref:Uncharacterized protein n=1 Tax=Rhizophora mucronata TaxID=61149 RepID=A0A2P2N9S4_RHIMU